MTIHKHLLIPNALMVPNSREIGKLVGNINDVDTRRGARRGPTLDGLVKNVDQLGLTGGLQYVVD